MLINAILHRAMRCCSLPRWSNGIPIGKRAVNQPQVAPAILRRYRQRTGKLSRRRELRGRKVCPADSKAESSRAMRGRVDIVFASTICGKILGES